MPVEADENAALGNTVFHGRCEVGAFSYFNYGVQVANATIGKFCSIGQESIIGMGMHPLDWLTTHPVGGDGSGISCGQSQNPLYKDICLTTISRKQPMSAQIHIAHDVWIGARAIIMPGVSIGTGAVIGAGAVVTRDVAPFSISTGVPARHIRYRLPAYLRQRVLESEWWDRDLTRLEERDYSDPEAFLDALDGTETPLRGGLSERFSHWLMEVQASWADRQAARKRRRKKRKPIPRKNDLRLPREKPSP